MFDRRDFLKQSTLLSLAPTVPAFLADTAHAAAPGRDHRILVVIQLSGGNDGINTVVPYADDGYSKLRTKLHLPEDRLIKVDDQIGFHPSMAGFGKLLESERLAVVQGVGYPNPNRSHDVSMAIWQTCSFDPTQHNTHGWLGRALDESTRPADGSPSALLIGDDHPPVALRGRRSVASAINGIDEYAVADSAIQPPPHDSGDSLAGFVQRTSLDAYTTAQRLREVSYTSDKFEYPSNALGERLKLISQLIKSDFGTRVFYAVQPGYDTHAAQVGTHSRLLRSLSDSIEVFLSDLRTANLDERVAVLCFSEFGRRAAENASQGTDHGTAGPVFLAGKEVAHGLHAETPSLTDLQDGDVKMSVDFRRVYASVLHEWLQIDSSKALQGRWEPMKLFQPLG